MRTPPKPTLLYGAGACPLLKASITTLAPLTAGTPKLSAAGPERKLTTPSLKVSCADALPKTKRPATSAAMGFIACPSSLGCRSVTFPPHENVDGSGACAAGGAAFRPADAVL